MIALQGVEHHQVVNPVEEFRPEIGGYDFQHRGLHGLVIRLAGLFPDAVRAQVRGHDDDGVAEVDGPALTVGQAPVVQHLQQHVENVGMGFFNLVQQHQAVRAAPYLFGKLAALVITDVARRRADEPGHRVLLHVFGHVDADDGVLAVEQEIRQRFAQFRLADAGGSEKQERSVWPVRVRQPGAGAPYGVRDRDNRFVLADHPAPQCLLHLQQLVPFTLQHLCDGYARPPGDDFGNLVFRYLVAQQLQRFRLGPPGVFQLFLEVRDDAVLQFRHPAEIAGTLRRLELHARLLQLLLDLVRALQRRFFPFPDLFQVGELPFNLPDITFQVCQALFRCLIGFLLQGLALDLHLDETPLQPVHRLRLGIDLDADAAGGLVDQVDGLVGQLPVGDVALPQGRRGDDRGVGDLDVVVHFITLFQAAQDGYGVVHAWFVDKHFLETPFQRRVFFDVLAVFVQGRGAYAVQLTPGQGGFQHVAGVHRPFRLAGADHGMYLIDEQDDAAFLFLQVAEYRLQAFLEFTAELCPGDERAHVQGQQAPAFQGIGHFAVDDPLRQALDDGCLAHAGLADQHRVVLRAPLQHLDGAADLLVPADDRVQFTADGLAGQIDGEFVQRSPVVFAVRVIDVFTAADFVDGGLDPAFLRAAFAHEFAEFRLVAGRGQGEQFAGDILIIALLRVFVGEVEQPVQVLRYVYFPVMPLHPGQVFHGPGRTALQLCNVHAGKAQQVGG